MAAAAAADGRFDIRRFDVSGNTLLPAARVEALLAPYTGNQRNFADLQMALEALEAAYREQGYGAVHVSLPEQEATSGVVRLEVSEARIGRVAVSGNQHFSEANVQRALPAVKAGTVPNLRRISENVQLANENPARKVEVSLAAGERDGEVDAKIAVTDRSPHIFNITTDNTGAAATGHWRTGVSYLYGNVMDLDHAASVAYTTSPDSPKGVKIRNYSIGYRLPIYSLGDSVDFIFGKSSSNTPSSTPTLGGALNIVGKGDVAGLRWNHNFARQGIVTRRLVASLDYKNIDPRCSTVDGRPVDIAPPTPPIASCVPYKVMPVGASYAVTMADAGEVTDWNIGLSVNVPNGNRYTNISGRNDRYSYLTPGNRDTRDVFAILRAGAGYFRAFSNGWQAKVSASGQLASAPLVTAESFGLTGAYSVRGYEERALYADSGVLASGELYTPEFGFARGLLFVDGAYGRNLKPNAVVPRTVNASAIGMGLRASLGKQASLRVDVAHGKDDTKAHAFLNIGY